MILRLVALRIQLSLTLGRAARRLRQVARTPGIATPDDIELLLRAHGVPERLVWDAVDRLAVGHVSAPVAWAYAMEYDGTTLAEMLVSSSDRYFSGL